MTPKNGGKIELKLGPSTPESAEYEAHLQTATAIFHTRVQVDASAGAGPKQVEFGAWASEAGGEPPEWLTADARAALKAALRTSQASGRWPRRIARWRPEP
jgi:hypothetical protein